ncbi:MAG: glycosyltransferase [Okeania sp. SIO3C4]|nr:glycosyltransferase [Okeania sp. SIO3C4]
MTGTSFAKANKFFQEGKLEEAIATYKKATGENSRFAWSHHNLGEALIKAGQIEEAAAAFRGALAINPNSAWSLHKLGAMLNKLGQYEEAVGYLRQAVEKRTNVPEFYLSLGTALAQLGEWSEAEEFLCKVVQFSPNSLPLNEEAKKAHGASLMTFYVSEAYFYLGEIKSGQQQWSEALEFYRQSWENNRGKLECCMGWAASLGKLGRWSEAVECYRQSASLFDESGEFLFRFGQALGQLGRWEEAVVEYRKAINLGFAGAEVRHHLGYALGQLGRWEEAVVEYRLVVEVNPKSAVVRHQLGYGLMRLERWREAEVELRKSVELYPGSAVVWQQLGDVLRELGERDEAVEVYRRALEFEPGLAEVAKSLESTLSGEDSYTKVDEPPKSPQDCYELANWHFNSGEWKEAITYYCQLIDSDLDSALVRRCLGFALAKEQRWQEAVVEYRQALDWHSSATNAYQDLRDFQDTEIYFFPDYRVTNPYQDLLYSHPPKGCIIQSGDLDLALQIIKHSLTPRKIVFHLHWTSFVLAPAKTVEEAEQLKNSFLIKLFDFLLEGGTFIWTIHNVLPHNCRYRKQETELRTILAAVANKIHLHSQLSVPAIAKIFPLPSAKIQIIHHGNYVGIYQNYVNRSHARQRFGYSPEDFVFLFLGQIRPYKGLEDLILAFNNVQKVITNAHLLIAGNASYPTKKGTTTAKAKLFVNVSVIEEHIPDNELQWFYAAADAVVLPYRDILTSGSVLSALSFARLVIAPDAGMIKEIIKDGNNGFTYDLGNINSLKKTMLKVANFSHAEREKMFDNSLKSVERLTWDNHVKLLLSGIKRLKPQNNLNLSWEDSTNLLNSNLIGVKEKIEIESGEIDCQIWNPIPSVTEAEKVAIIILNYNTTDDAIKLVKSLDNSSYKKYAIVIVDNASTTINFQELIEKFGDFTVIRTSKNLGYAGGNNTGIKYVKNKGFEFVWIINPDTFVKRDSLENLVIAAQEHKDISVYGSVILWAEQPETVWYGGAIVEFNDSGFQTYQMYSGKHKSLIPDTIYDVDYVAGTSLFCRTKLFDEVGLIPEHYFLYFEETEWCLEAIKKGHRVAVIPSSQIYHAKRSQLGKLPTKTYFYYYIRASVLFMRKYFSQDGSLIVNSIKNKFIQPWLDKIEKQAPQHTAYFTALAEKALEDGLNGITGWVNLRHILEKPTQHFFKSENLSIYGCLESVNSKKISGWVCNKNQLQERLKVTICIDSKVENFVVADKYREDLKLLGYGDGYYGFEMPTPKILYDSHPHSIKAFVEDSIPLKTNIIQPFIFKLNSLYYQARIDGISVKRFVQGWALDTNNPHQVLTVEILDGNHVILQAECNKERPDLLKAGFPTKIAGFSVPIPVAYCDGKEHSLSLRVAGTKRVLFSRKVRMSTDKYPLLYSVSSAEELLKKLYHYREISMVHPEHREPDYLKQLEAMGEKLTQEFANKPQNYLVSVVMPAYNREKTIVSALESVISQSYKNWELIIVNDGSIDDTVQVVKEFIKQYSDRQITLIDLAENSGVSVARNTGLAKAKGEIIAYLDSDNSWEPDFLLIMVNSLIDNEQIKVAYCGDKIWQHYPGNTTLPSASELASVRLGPFNKSLIENRNYIDLNVFVHKRELYQELGGFREDMRRLVDWELIVRYTDFASPKFVPALLANYNMDWSENQITRVENFDKNWVKMKETLAKVGRGEISKLTPVKLGETLQILVIGGNGDFDSLNLSLQAITANTELERAKIIVYLSHSSVVNGHQLMSRFQGVADIKLRYSNSNRWSEVVADAAKQLPEKCAMVVLSDEGVVSANWLVALQKAGSGNKVGVVVPRQIISGNNPRATELVPYARGFYDVDVALIPEPDFILNPCWQDNQLLVELSGFNCFCVYFNFRLIKSIDWQKLVKMENIDWMREVANSIQGLDEMSIIYTPLARVFDISYFQ